MQNTLNIRIRIFEGGLRLYDVVTELDKKIRRLFIMNLKKKLGLVVGASALLLTLGNTVPSHTEVARNDLPAEFSVKNVAKNDLPAEFSVKNVAKNDLPAEFSVKNVAKNDLPAEFSVKNVAKNDLPAEFSVKNVAKNDLPAEFIVKPTNSLS